MSYRATILEDAPARYWRLSDAAGAAAAVDAAGVANGTYGGSPTLGAAGPFLRDTSTAMSADGTDDRMEVTDAADLDLTTGWSVECWFNGTSFSHGGGSNFPRIVSKGASSGNGYQILVDQAAGPLLAVQTQGLSDTTHQSVSTLETGRWYHAVVTYDGSNVRIYLNGVIDYTGPATGSVTTNATNLFVGRRGDGSNHWNGKISDVAIYAAVLTPAQVAAHYAARLLYDYASFLDSPAPDVAVLLEVQPMEPLRIWNSAGGGFTNTYYTFYQPQIATSIVPGGIYRRLDKVRQDATDLTSRASIALVDANPGSYFHDTAAGRIYVHPTVSGNTPESYALVGAWFTLFFSTAPVNFPQQPQYWPILTGELPTLAGAMPDPLFGALITSSGSVSLLNGDALFDRLATQYVWRNKRATFKLGGASLNYADFSTVAVMRVNTVNVDDELATLALESMGSILNQSLPATTWSEDSEVTASDEELQQPRPIQFGASDDCRMTRINNSQWYIANSPDLNPLGTVVRGLAFSVNKATGEHITLTSGIDYVLASGGGYTYYDMIGSYEFPDYDFTINLSSTPTQYPGGFAKRLLELCGEDAANIDTAAFDAIDAAYPIVVGLHLQELTPAADIMRTLEQSVPAQVYIGTDGRWTMRVINFDGPADWTLTDADFVEWTPVEAFDAVLSQVRVEYAANPYLKTTSQASRTSDRVQYANETTDTHTVKTYIYRQADAQSLASKLFLFKSGPTRSIRFEARGLALMGASVGDLVAVTRARGPVARTGAYEGQLLLLTELTKALGPGAPVIRGVLTDVAGTADKIGRYAPAGLTWGAATPAEKAIYGFYSDLNGYIDTADGLTRHGKVYV